MYIYMYIYIYICLHTYMHMHLHIQIHIQIHAKTSRPDNRIQVYQPYMKLFVKGCPQKRGRSAEELASLQGAVAEQVPGLRSLSQRA